jgi:hypothetical protein
MHYTKKILLGIITILSSQYALAQDTTKLGSEISFSIGGEFKSRFEVRNGYRTLVPEDTSAAIFGNLRTRLNLDFKSPHVNA